MKITAIATIAAVAVAVSAHSYPQEIICATKGFAGHSYDESKVCCEYSGNCGALPKCTANFCSSSNEYKITCAEKRKRNRDSLKGLIHKNKKCCQWSGKCGDLKKCTQSYCEKDARSSDIYKRSDFQF
ncbi:hypothetical protein SARC_02309 [Sphaeroforma arctica JP610]|uniref:Uncharacterized protein n=1 Tax=Sphaeroforma arctica JP610 TaxID=667725 RepID=A0A0L0GB71_9EUKA|nr:hypothetical protein SARC_02309 [Sphaeroforma arctica JP610]KNC85508.1 hypothetical protein SARC_02309 [Sphaeroforma arctica JP610]|eukprot:XP_014159410.1 hypothetical protein SARC_02309 [Sphaeroforma arctica JP610]